MKRARAVVLVAGVVLVGSLATAVAVPRYPGCPPGYRFLDTTEAEWTDRTAVCEELPRPVTPTAHLQILKIADRRDSKVAIAIGGVVAASALAAVAFASTRRTRRPSVPAGEVGM